MGLKSVSITELTLRIEWDGKPIVFSAAGLSLQGPTGKRQLGLFTNASIWQAPKGV